MPNRSSMGFKAFRCASENSGMAMSPAGGGMGCGSGGSEGPSKAGSGTPSSPNGAGGKGESTMLRGGRLVSFRRRPPLRLQAQAARNAANLVVWI